MSDLIKQEKKEEHDEEQALSSIPTPSEALHKLKEMAKAAFRDKQALLFHELEKKIHSYSYDTSNPELAVPNPNMPQEVRNLALGIWTELQNMWESRDQKDFVYHNGLFVIRRLADRLSYADGSSQNQWNPKDSPLKLPAELRDYLKSNYRGIITQQPLDLAYLIHNLAETHHDSLDQETYDRMIIVGYQLMLISAKMIMHFRKRSPATYLLYLIRDAQHAQPAHSEHVKECLTAFNDYLTAEALQHNMRIRRDLNWRSSRRGLRGEPSSSLTN
ncbi:hypothetical protein H0H93_012219 [Arthromyces matolae]|nr:hypothetical protein H0H93_012219 [Arthromyces matolae]